MTRINEARLRAIHEAIDSAARLNSTELHRRLGLAEIVKLPTFRKYAQHRRRDHKRRLAAEQADSSTASSAQPSSELAPSRPASALQTCIENLYQQLLIGAIPAYVLPGAIRALVSVGELDIKQEAEKRAAELHEVTRRELLAAAKNASTGADGKEKSLTRGDVYDLIDQVMRGAA